MTWNYKVFCGIQFYKPLAGWNTFRLSPEQFETAYNEISRGSDWFTRLTA